MNIDKTIAFLNQTGKSQITLTSRRGQGQVLQNDSVLGQIYEVLSRGQQEQR
jgi:hypothetical protein